MRKGYLLQLNVIIKDYDNIYKQLLEQYNNGVILLPKSIELVDTYNIEGDDKPIKLLDSSKEQDNWVR